MGCLGYEIKAKIGEKHVRVHTNRLRKIHADVVQSRQPEDGVFPDSMRMLRKIKGTNIVTHEETGQPERMFRMQIGRRKAARRTRERDLSEVVVKLFDAQETQEATSNRQPEYENVNDNDMPDIDPRHK